MNKVSFYVLWQLVDYIYTCIEYEFRLTAHYCYSLTSIQRDLRVHKTLTTGDLIQRGLNLNVDCPQNRKILIFALMFTVPQVTPILLPSPIQNDAVRSTLYVQQSPMEYNVLQIIIFFNFYLYKFKIWGLKTLGPKTHLRKSDFFATYFCVIYRCQTVLSRALDLFRHGQCMDLQSVFAQTNCVVEIDPKATIPHVCQYKSGDCFCNMLNNCPHGHSKAQSLNYHGIVGISQFSHRQYASFLMSMCLSQWFPMASMYPTNLY